MLTLLLLSALVGQTPPSVDATVTIENTSVVVTVRPKEGQTVKALRLQAHPKRVRVNQEDPGGETAPTPKPAAPRKIETLANGNVRASFDRPRTTFHIVVTLTDKSVHRIDP